MDEAAVKQNAAQDYELNLTDGVRVTASGDPASPVLKRFFEGYDRAFVLPDEREDLSGFETCLALNRTHRLAHGRTQCELVAVLETEGGDLLGGANFLATTIKRAGAPPASVALNYIYVETAARGRGLLRTLLQRGIERGEFRALDLETAIDVIYAPLMMLVVWRSSLCFCAKETDPATYLKTHFDLLVQGLCQPKGLA